MKQTLMGCQSEPWRHCDGAADTVDEEVVGDFDLDGEVILRR